MKRKKVLVTGATGFIGRSVVEVLLTRDIDIIASSRQKRCPAGWDGKPGLFWIPLDLESLDNQTDYFSYFGSPDAMIHLAWEGLPHFKEDFHLSQNLPRHYAFLSNIISNGLKDLTVTGTCLEYGMREGMLSEELEPNPVVAYAMAKNKLREQLETVLKKHSVHFRWLRLFYMFGEGQHPNSLYPQLLKAIKEGDSYFNMSGGEQERDFLSVQQMAEKIVLIALQHQVLGIINVCSGKPVKVKDFVQGILAEKGSPLRLNLGYYPYADYEPMSFWGNNCRLQCCI